MENLITGSVCAVLLLVSLSAVVLKNPFGTVRAVFDILMTGSFFFRLFFLGVLAAIGIGLRSLLRLDVKKKQTAR